MGKQQQAEFTQKEINDLIRNFTNSIVFNDKPQAMSELLSIIDRPFRNDNNNDLLSMIYHRFYCNSDIPVALPVFGFLSILSAWCVLNNTRMRPPLETKDFPLDTWIFLLSDTGVAKTTSFSWMKDVLPKNEVGEPVINANFKKAAGPASFIQNLSELEGGKGFWIQDEASQFISLVEKEGHPMSELKEVLLEMKDHKKIRRSTKQDIIETDPIEMTILFINTIDSMARKISEESFHDGLMRRYTVGIAKRDERDFTDFANYDVSKICDESLKEKMLEVFSTDIRDKVFTYSKGAVILFEKMFKIFWHKQYIKFMTGCETTYRTYYRESYKYAIFHHIINQKEGCEIDTESMEWALKVVMYYLNSLQAFVEYRANLGKSAIAVQTDRLSKMIAFIKENDGKPNFGLRAFCRKFNIKKDEAISYLLSIKTHNPKLKTKLWDAIESK